MCRLAMLNKIGFEEMEGKFGIVPFLDYLEKMNGGHGNGYILIKDGNIIEWDKGAKLSNTKIYEHIVNIDFDWFLYHTRITSQGTTCDEQCHPFVTKEKDFALMMNGTEKPYGDIGKLIGTNDTDALFRVFHALNIHEGNLKGFDSRFMGFRKDEKGKGYVWFTNPKHSYQSLKKLKSKNKNSIVVASCFPNIIKEETVQGDYYWKEGEKIKTATAKSYVSPYSTYGRSSTWWENYKVKNTEQKKLKDDILTYCCSACGSMYKKEIKECIYGCKNGFIEQEILTFEEYEQFEQFFCD